MQKSIDFFDFFGGPGPGVRGPFGRMGNVNWVILGFRPEKCTQIFLGPQFSDFRPKGGCASSRLDHGLKVELDPYIKNPKRIFPSKKIQKNAGFSPLGLVTLVRKPNFQRIVFLEA